MSEIEVGQVWIDPQGNKADIIGIERRGGIIRNIAMQSRVTNKLAMGEFHELIKKHTLITNADGTPHTPPNDYQAGDVWEWIEAKEPVMISMCGDLVSAPNVHPEQLAGSNLTVNPQEYRLIYRMGQGVVND